MRELYPPIEPFDEGFLHGGPGGGLEPGCRRSFVPARWHLTLCDERGSGKSPPNADLRESTTGDLVADAGRIRERLGVEEPGIPSALVQATDDVASL